MTGDFIVFFGLLVASAYLAVAAFLGLITEDLARVVGRALYFLCSLWALAFVFYDGDYIIFGFVTLAACIVFGNFIFKKYSLMQSFLVMTFIAMCVISSAWACSFLVEFYWVYQYSQLITPDGLTKERAYRWINHQAAER